MYYIVSAKYIHIYVIRCILGSRNTPRSHTHHLRTSLTKFRGRNEFVRFSRSPNSEKRIINIGTTGGFTKASSGYTFQFIQKNSEKIIQNLLKGKLPNPKKTFRDKMFEWYDRTVLEVMISKKMSGKEIFSIMFKNLSPEKILAFLGNESKFADEIKIMNIFPKSLFIIAGIKRLR